MRLIVSINWASDLSTDPFRPQGKRGWLPHRSARPRWKARDSTPLVDRQLRGQSLKPREYLYCLMLVFGPRVAHERSHTREEHFFLSHAWRLSPHVAKKQARSDWLPGRSPRRIELPDRQFAPRQCTALVAIHPGEFCAGVGQDERELLGPLWSGLHDAAHIGRKREALPEQFAGLGELPDPGEEILSRTIARIGESPRDQVVARAAHLDEVDLRLRNPARQAEKFAIGGSGPMVCVFICWCISICWCTSAIRWRTSAIRWRISAERADFPCQNLDLGRGGRIAKYRRGQAVAMRVLARACLAGGRKRPSAGRPIDESGTKPPLFRPFARRASRPTRSTTHVISLWPIGRVCRAQRDPV